MAFIEFLKRLYDMESDYLGPEGAAAGPMMAGSPNGMTEVGFARLLSELQNGAEATRPDRADMPSLAGNRPNGRINLDVYGPKDSDAGDLVDVNSEVSGSPLAGLFGSGPLSPITRAPAGVNQRRPGRP